VRVFKKIASKKIAEAMWFKFRKESYETMKCEKEIVAFSMLDI